MAELNPNPTVEVLYAANAEVGEGPFFDEDTNQLLWVDIHKKTVNFLSIETGENKSVTCTDTVSGVIAVEENENLLLVSNGVGLYIMEREGKIKRMLCSVDNDKPGNRLNDFKCDSGGRIWFGSMAREPEFGQDYGCHLYSYYKIGLKKFDPVLLSNGMDWNVADNVMYYIDSHTKKVYRYDFEEKEGHVRNREVFIDYAQDDALALPDGMCTDSKDRLWVASFGGERVTCWDPETKKSLLTLKIPGAKNITSCCFGGPDYEWLFVTSATFGLSEEELAAYPNSGSVFVVKDLGASGRPPNKFKL